jgi:hypothetical protein
MAANKHTKWEEKTTKEKLDLVFVVIAIITFSLTTYIHLRNINGHK